MPHIVIDVSAHLLARIDWQATCEPLHRELARRGWAALDDLKSRVQPIAVGLCGSDRDSLQLIATLTLTNPRPPEVCQAMAQCVYEHLSRAAQSAHDGAWLQCCVFLAEVPKANYRKQQWNAPLPMAPDAV